MLKLLPVVVLVVGLTPRTLAAPQPADAVSQPAAGRDQVIVGIFQEPARRLNPIFTGSSVGRMTLATIFTADVESDSAWKPFPQGVEYLPNLKDGTWRIDGERMTLVWKLRRRNWHDGRPVTCGDYVFTHTAARNLLVRVPGEITRMIAGVECPKEAGGIEVRVTWKQPYAYANLHVIEFGPIPRHLLEPTYRRSPAGLLETPFGTQAEATIGDGAYRLMQWRRGESVTVEAVPNHPIFGTPRIRRITWRYLPDQTKLAAAMLSGAIDATSVVGINSADLGLQLNRQAAGRFNVAFVPSLLFEHLDFNLDNPFLRDVRIRRAIAHGINRTQIVQDLFQGKQPVAHTYLPPRHFGYTEHVHRYPYDPARARALLRDAGFSPGPDGVFINAAGQRLSLEVNTTAGTRAREQIAQMIQQHLATVGIEVTIQNFPGRVLLDNGLTSQRRFKGMVMYSWIFSPESDCDSLYTSDGIPTKANGWRGFNYPGYRNLEMDRLCKGAHREIDEGRRRQLLQESARIFSRDLPALPLYFRVIIVASKTGLQNFSVSISDSLEAWNAHMWYWK